MLDESGVARVEIAGANRVDHLLVISPHGGQVVIFRITIKLNGFVGLPVGFKNAPDKGIFQAVEDRQCNWR